MGSKIEAIETLLEPAPRSLTNLSIELTVDDVLRGQGMEPKRASDRIAAVAEEILDEAQPLLAPMAIYTYAPVRTMEHESVIVASDVASVSLTGVSLRRAIADASAIAAAICTIGPSLEERMSERLADGDMLHALALDGAGTIAVREVARQVSDCIRRDATSIELTMSMTASPGQEGWPLEEQLALFKLLPAEQIEVSLTETGMMKPFKSVSFVAGLGQDMDTDATPCDFCSRREHCRWTLSPLQRCG
jgi:hypothetical protein